VSEKLRVAVSYSPSAGFVSQACPKVSRSLTAPNLDRLRWRIIMLILGRSGRLDRPVTVELELDATAQAERDRRSGYDRLEIACYG
jgi:hypothetical protein